jgi:hypothetical protein
MQVQIVELSNGDVSNIHIKNPLTANFAVSGITIHHATSNHEVITPASPPEYRRRPRILQYPYPAPSP